MLDYYYFISRYNISSLCVLGEDTCSCNPGFTLQDDGSCTDVDECTDGADTCASAADNGVCTNNPGSYSCSCIGGYTLGPSNECDGKI